MSVRKTGRFSVIKEKTPSPIIARTTVVHKIALGLPIGTPLTSKDARKYSKQLNNVAKKARNTLKKNIVKTRKAALTKKVKKMMNTYNRVKSNRAVRKAAAQWKS
jgi:hypothetical protein